MPKKVELLDFMTGIESALPRLSRKEAERFRCEASILFKKKTNFLKMKLSKAELKAMLELKWDESLITLTTNKGTVILVAKIPEILNADKYTLLTKYPTIHTKLKLQTHLGSILIFQLLLHITYNSP